MHRTKDKQVQLEKGLHQANEQIDEIRQRLDDLTGSLKSAIQRMENFDIKIQSIKNQPTNQTTNYNTSSVNQSDIDDITKQLKALKQQLDTMKYEFDRMKEDTSYKFNEVGKQLIIKAN